ncbi:hypothetical protein BGZ70_006059 [Mortierella alpina]|uniref:HotDog ACOT-type domain-containing protein n=1 Tax=Mortierella alpina TaxID=64518 RepID=A0A9P6J8U7_MORAP|nr:hypothetical protein BGZ70_006059 [Mortierella alpina]
MAEHMDRHLAEQIQGHESVPTSTLKRPRETENHIPDKKTRDISPRRQSAHARPVKEVQTTGQTTLESFMTRTPREIAIPQKSTETPPPPRELLFVPDASTSSIGVVNIIPKTRLLLEASKVQGVTRQAYLADPSVVFYQSDKTDRAWGCGYRNLQMMLSYVVSQGVARQDESFPASGAAATIPTITELQRQLEYAWQSGFDPPGAEQLRHKVEGTKKWIGTTEAWSVLCSLGIRCSILDFHTPTGPNGTHPAMLAAVYDYFRNPAWSPLRAPGFLQVADLVQSGADQQVVQTAKPPLYMQHQGHSRTIIGVEVQTNGEVNLLVFDPGRWLHKAIPTMRQGSISKGKTPTLGSKLMTEAGLLDPQYLLRAFRLDLGRGTSKAQYQLLGISGLFHEGDESGREPHRNVLELFSENASLSIGWDSEEREQSKSIIKTPLYFAVTKSTAKDSAPTTHKQSAQALKKETELLDKLGVKNHGGAATTVITTQGAKTATALPTAAGAPRNKVFTVRPITSWIDKLAQEHGSPTSTSSTAPEQSVANKKYEKRELVLKSMQDSYTEIILPFATDKALLEEYINFGGNVRHGKIMEDLDALAGAISYKHCDDGKSDSSPLIIVTASVDRIDFLKPFGVSDLRLSGHVTYVGYSSMEVFMKMEEIPADKPDGHGDTILVARFTMVARDALTGRAAQVNPMLLQNDTEKKLFQMGEDHKAKKRLAAESALTKRPPTEVERFLIHDLYLEYSKYDDPQRKVKKPDNVEWMADTKMSAIQIMQPQDRNIHDKIFGGYLMRLAYELAFCNASVFIKYRPTFLALDEISFRKPVPIGTFLALDSQIVFAEGGDHHSFQVMVKADVLDVVKDTRETTNEFWFTFSDPNNEKGHATPKVMPRTYAESMLYLEGQRRRKEGVKLAQLNRMNLGI